MDFLTNKLKSRFRTTKKSPQSANPPSPSTPSPTYRQRQFSLFQPRVRTNFDSSVNLGVIESPQQSPETPYSGVPKFGQVEVVTRVAKGEVTTLQLAKKAVNAVTVKPGGTKKRLKSLDAGAVLTLTENEARLDYSTVAGLLFTAVAPKVDEVKPEFGRTRLSLTASQALKLRQAVAVDRELAYYQKRTMRETRMLETYQETLNTQLQPLETRFEATKTSAGADLTAEQLAIQKGIARIREEIAEAEKEKAVVEKRLGDARSEFEQFTQTALALLASLLEEQVLADEEVVERKRSEDRFTKRYTVPEGFGGL